MVLLRPMCEGGGAPVHSPVVRTTRGDTYRCERVRIAYVPNPTHPEDVRDGETDATQRSVRGRVAPAALMSQAPTHAPAWMGTYTPLGETAMRFPRNPAQHYRKDGMTVQSDEYALRLLAQRCEKDERIARRNARINTRGR